MKEIQNSILEELGFKKIVNAAGHYTMLGGSRPYPVANHAMELASRYWIDMNDLQRNAGNVLKSLLGCEDGMITTGAYSALVIATNVAMLGVRPGLKHKVIVQSSHVTRYSEAFRAAGVDLLEIERESKSESIKDHADDSTVALAYVVSEAKSEEFSLEETVEAGNELGIPVIVDASLVDPPITGIKNILNHAPSLVAVSGGKGFNGPNNSGILIGKADLVESARKISFPNYGVGRGMKISKEQIAGLVATIKFASTVNEEELIQSWKDTLEKIRKQIVEMPGVSTRIDFPWKLNIPQPVPRLYIIVDEASGGKTKAEEIRNNLRYFDPPIMTRPPSDARAPENSIVIEGRCIEPEDIETLVKGINSSLVARLKETT